MSTRLFIAALLVVPALANAACLTLASHPSGTRLWSHWLPASDTSFAISYLHSATRSPVSERYQIAGNEIVETEIRFEQHGPGLPTQADAGGTFTRSDGRFVVTMDRRFPDVVMQVHADQSPRLAVGARVVDLAQWGNRALILGVSPEPCSPP